MQIDLHIAGLGEGNLVTAGVQRGLNPSKGPHLAILIILAGNMKTNAGHSVVFVNNCARYQRKCLNALAAKNAFMENVLPWVMMNRSD